MTTSMRPPRSSSRATTSIGGSAAVNLLVRVAGAGTSILFLVLAARRTTDETVGLLALLTTVALVGTVIARFGTENTLTALADDPGATDADNRGAWSAGVAGSTRLVAVTAGIVSLLLLLLSGPLGAGLSDDPELVSVLRLGPLAIIAMTVAGTCGGALRGRHRPIAGSIVDGALAPTVSLAALASTPSVSITALAWLWILGWALAATLGLSLVVAELRRPDTGAAPVGTIDVRTLVNEGHPVVTIGLMNLALASSDLLVLGWLETDATVGHYAVASRIVGVSTLVLTAVNGILQPRIAAAHRAGRLAELRPLLRSTTQILAVLGLLIFAALAAGGRVILGVFGPEFELVSTALLLLAAGQALVLTTGPAGAILLMTGRQRTQREATLAAVVVNIGADLALIPRFGATGAAAATALAIAVKNVYAAARALEALDA